MNPKRKSWTAPTSLFPASRIPIVLYSHTLTFLLLRTFSYCNHGKLLQFSRCINCRSTMLWPRRKKQTRWWRWFCPKIPHSTFPFLIGCSARLKDMIHDAPRSPKTRWMLGGLLKSRETLKKSRVSDPLPPKSWVNPTKAPIESQIPSSSLESF